MYNSLFMSAALHWTCGLSLFVALSSPTMGQRTWTVSRCQEYQADFTDLPAAVAAASPGDTILLVETLPCIGPTLNSTVIDKPLTIVGILSGGPTGSGSVPNIVGVLGRMTIRNIPAGAKVVLLGLGSGWGRRP